MTFFYCGTSGLVLPVPNKAAFPDAYREGSRLTYYSSLFNSIEINSSFYRLPRRVTMEKWVTEVPDGFRFTLKLWRGVTHEQDLSFSREGVRTFMEAAAGIGRKKGCLLVQLPPGLRAGQIGKLEELLDLLVAGDPDRGWNIAVEFRHPSWYVEETRELLLRWHVGLVLQDMPASASWGEAGDGNFVYLRYHGPAGDYKGGYADGRLYKDAERIRRWLTVKKSVYVYFNNTIGDALIDLERLRTLVLLPVA
jgi:uncharacterized protein YecE (DUF72 family)